MKSIKLSFFFVIVLAGLSVLAKPAAAQQIEGNGQMQSQNREAGNFNEISSSGPFDIVLTQGNTTSVKVEAESNLLPYIITEVQGNKLVLKTKKGVDLKPDHEITIAITFKDLNQLKISGAGSLKGTNTLKLDRLALAVSGTTKVDLSLQSNSLSMGISGTTRADLKGSAAQADYRISGTADIDASDLISDNARVAVSGAGKLHVNASKKLDVSISGVGKVWYKGNPAISQSVSGMGVVRQE